MGGMSFYANLAVPAELLDVAVVLAKVMNAVVAKKAAKGNIAEEKVTEGKMVERKGD